MTEWVDGVGMEERGFIKVYINKNTNVRTLKWGPWIKRVCYTYGQNGEHIRCAQGFISLTYDCVSDYHCP